MFLLSAGLLCCKADLVKNGKTTYTIVVPDQQDTGNRFAAKELSFFLKKASGADFKVVPVSKAPGKNRIFLGVNPLVGKLLKGDPRKGLKAQEHCVKTAGNDLFLYGQGSWGDLFAVYDYLENVLGYRFYDARGGMKIPDLKNAAWKKLNRKTAFSVPFRSATGYWIYHRPNAHLFFLRNRQNYALIDRFLKMEKIQIPAIEMPAAYGSHTLPSYIPSSVTAKSYKPYSWLKNKDYFKTNPDYFAMDPKGKRSPRGHLCFSNPALRKELTANILENMRRQPQCQTFSVSAHDSPGRFCYCKECLAREKEYSCIGGPFFDYLLELSKIVKEKHPRNNICFLVYRKGQTQKPPANIRKLPDNLMPIFAPIDDDFSKSWAHKANQETAQDLMKWGRLSKYLAIWYYPNPYSGVITPPLGNINRLIHDIRTMVKAGMTHSFFEHNVGVCDMTGWTELQTFLILQLFKDVHQDAEKLIREFMVFEYGKAAPLMRQYLAELEEVTAKTTLTMQWNGTLNTYTHLTADNLVRWYNLFKRMEKVLEKDPVRLENVNRVRLNLEYALLLKYNQVIKKYPGFERTPRQLADSVLARFKDGIKKFYNKGFEMRSRSALRSLNETINTALIMAGKEGKALPAEIFGKIPADRIIQVVPRTNAGGPRFLEDKGAAWGVAAYLIDKSKPTLPFYFNVYDYANRKYHPNINRLRKHQLKKRGQYNLYRVADFTVSPHCDLRLGKDSWYEIRADLSGAYEMGSLNRVTIYASLKFEGATFYKEDAGKKDKVFCDRVIVVKHP